MHRRTTAKIIRLRLPALSTASPDHESRETKERPFKSAVITAYLLFPEHQTVYLRLTQGTSGTTPALDPLALFQADSPQLRHRT